MDDRHPGHLELISIAPDHVVVTFRTPPGEEVRVQVTPVGEGPAAAAVSVGGRSEVDPSLAIWLGATVNGHLKTEIPDPTVRREVSEAIVKQATPYAVNAEVGPGRPLGEDTPLERKVIERAAGKDFERGMQIAIGFAIALSIFGWFLTFFGLPRGHGAIAAAESEAERIEVEEDS